MIQLQKLAAPTQQDREAILEGLDRFNESSLSFPRNYESIVFVLRDAHSIVGGIWAGVWYSYLYVEALIVPEQLRKRGYGSQLLRGVEAEAVLMGCHAAWLDTYSFQARGFYEHLGYSVFGSLHDYPPGHTRYFLTKSLSIVSQPHHSDG